MFWTISVILRVYYIVYYKHRQYTYIVIYINTSVQICYFNIGISNNKYSGTTVSRSLKGPNQKIRYIMETVSYRGNLKCVIG